VPPVVPPAVSGFTTYVSGDTSLMSRDICLTADRRRSYGPALKGWARVVSGDSARAGARGLARCAVPSVSEGDHELPGDVSGAG